MLHRDSPLEAQREHGVPQQVGNIELLPALIAGDAQHPEADIIVHTEDVGVLVMAEVVGEPPVLGGPRAWSHSHDEEWISGSFIQSHWPCMTLWPISMFSMIFAKPSVTAPAHHAERLEPAASMTRPATSRPLWAAIVRRIYRTSRSPRESSMSRRIASRVPWSLGSAHLSQVSGWGEAGSGGVGVDVAGDGGQRGAELGWGLGLVGGGERDEQPVVDLV